MSNVQRQLREEAVAAHPRIPSGVLTKSDFVALETKVKAAQAAYRKAEAAGWTCHPDVTSELNDLATCCQQAARSSHELHTIEVDRSHREFGGPTYLVLQAV